MTCCTYTARNIGRELAPCWNSRDMKKNRLELCPKNLDRLLDSTIAYVHVQWETGSHDFIIRSQSSELVEIVDSWIDYRDQVNRSYLKEEIAKCIRNGDTYFLDPPEPIPVWSGWFVIIEK
jgi:hypothetical protein